MSQKRFWTLLRAACLCIAMAGLASADTFVYSGNFNFDDDLVTIPVDLSVFPSVIITTSSFANGGFAPVIAFFDPSGTLLAEDVNGNSGGCPTADPVTGFCWDDYISLPDLPAGDYTLALTEDDNLPNGPTLADGFYWGTGNSNDFTGPEFLSQPGSFIMAGGSQRTSAWALEVDLVPEPSEMAPLIALALALAARKLRAKGRTE